MQLELLNKYILYFQVQYLRSIRRKKMMLLDKKTEGSLQKAL